jgi:hypothetical protein
MQVDESILITGTLGFIIQMVERNPLLLYILAKAINVSLVGSNPMCANCV